MHPQSTSAGPGDRPERSASAGALTAAAGGPTAPVAALSGLELWAAIDAHLGAGICDEDEALDAALDASRAAGLPEIHVAPNQGKLLWLLARAIGARRMLEIGTLGGYSAIWLARALPPEGRLITLEASPRHAEVARANIARAGLSTRVDICIGAALDTLPKLAAAGAPPFDLVFIDADKTGYCDYLDWSLRLTRPGGLIIADNVVRGGRVLDASCEDPNVVGVRRFNARLAAEPRVSATIIQTVGGKGHDGLAFMLVN